MSQNTGLSSEDIRKAAQALLRLIEDRSRRVLEARFGVTGDEPQTLQAVGDREHLTRERVRQIESVALGALRARASSLQSATTAALADLRSLLVSLGGSVLEDTLFEAVGGASGRDRGALRLLLTTLPGVAEARETKRTFAHWTVTDLPSSADGGAPPPSLELVLETAERILSSARHVLPESEFFAAVKRELGRPVGDRPLRSLLAAGRGVVRTPFGEWGLKGWTEATPRSAGDKAYVILRRAGKPLHFTAMTEAINRAGFAGKRAHAQTVHNELIRSDRFVLVGRGLYGLKEWGYKPGTVADVLVRLLKEAGPPLSKQRLVESALKQRFVKRNTVLLALQNRRLFRDIGDGRYALAEPTPAAPETPGST